MLLHELTFGFRRKLPVHLQTEAAECGLACLSMIATFHGHRIDLATLRRKHPVSLKGMTLANLMRIAESLQLATRPLRLELEDMGKLRLPCVLHWDMSHFVVLQEVRGKWLTIHDPAFGIRKLSIDEASKHFTGVALELWPNPGFEFKSEERRVKLRELMGHVTGLFRALVQIFVLAIALELFGLVSPFFMQWVVDEAIVSADRDLLTTLALGFGLLLIVQVLISTARAWVLMFMSTTLSVQWRANVFTHLLRLPVQYFQKRHLGDVASRFGSIDQIQDTLTTSFVAALLDGIMSIATLTMMFIYSVKLGFIALGVMMLYAISRWVSFRSLRTATDAQIVFAAKQSSHFLESVRGVKSIKLFRREDHRRTTWLSLLVDQINASLKVQKLQVTYGSINSLLIGIENIVIIWLGARMVLDGEFSVGMLFAFKAYKDQFDGRVSSLIDKLFQFNMLKLQGARLADIVLTEPESKVSATAESITQDRATDVAISNLQFRYSENEPLVLNGVDLKIGEGESVAIVGPSGCGKTTLMHALLGVLEPTAGQVMIGSINIKLLGIDTLRSLIGTVTQDDTLLAGSIADNICFFDPEADQVWIEECARMAAVHEEIMAMPMGYNSLVGDMGTVLSGGQKQRVLLARALYKKPKILFLDEATSHLDIEKERQVNTAIKALSITRVIIAHRPETIASANRIVTLAGGKILSDTKQSSTSSTSAPVQSNTLPLQQKPSLPNQEQVNERTPTPISKLPLAPAFMRLQ